MNRPWWHGTESGDPRDTPVRKRKTFQGMEYEETEYPNGATTHHGSGPCCDIHYDENGEECSEPWSGR